MSSAVMKSNENPRTRRNNMLLALLLGGLAAGVLIASFPFWVRLLATVGNGG